jgi:membrane protein DedA with SNARE-associated domain
MFSKLTNWLFANLVVALMAWLLVMLTWWFLIQIFDIPESYDTTIIYISVVAPIVAVVIRAIAIYWRAERT